MRILLVGAPAYFERAGRPKHPRDLATHRGYDSDNPRVAGDVGITVLDAVECWIYQHGLRHMGEIELARGLVGLGGMTS